MLIKNDYKPRMSARTASVPRPIVPKGREMLILGIVGCAFLALLGRGIYLQTQEHDFLKKEGNQRFVRTIPLVATRGSVIDRNGAVLAINAPADSLYAVPSAISELPSQDKLQKLSDLIGLSVETIKERLGQTSNGKKNKKKEFVYLKRQLDPKVVQQIEALNIKGLAFQYESKRHYPMGDLFAHVIGFTNIDGRGQEGLELSREKILHGQDGAKVVLRDNKGNIVDSYDSPRNQMPVNGQDIVLSLDQRIQSLTYEALNKSIQFHQASAGSALVLDAHTGEILSLVNAPDYDPNNPSGVPSDSRRNRAVTDMIEPGSAMKPFAIAKGVDSGKITPNTRMSTSSYVIGGALVKDPHPYPELDITGVIQKSSNVGTSKVSAMFPARQMYDFYSSIGIGRRMHLGFPGETPGLLRDWRSWRPIEQATMSFGYGLQMSLLQLARAYTIFTNNGELLPVSFLKLDRPPQGEPIIKPETARVMRKMMMTVTERGGTGTQGAVAGFDVAAKTGTARMLVDGQYSANKHMATFIGFAPANNPRVIVAVNIQNPTVNGYYGGVVAGPVFKEIMAGTLSALGETPSKAVKQDELMAKR